MIVTGMPALAPPVTVLLISGSSRAGSTNAAVLRTAAADAPRNVTTVDYDGIGSLPLFNPDDDREGAPVDQRVAEMRRRMAEADAVLICTPEYAGALPAAMKNLLEWTIGDAGTYGKPVAWINAAGPAAPTGAADAHESLRKVLGYAGAEIIETACRRIPVTRDAVGPTGLVENETARAQIRQVLESIAAHLAARSTA
ncbi:MAG TPA: NADPH-dependent FMN reductase [Solirubrobacteraceae bacterium]